MRYALLVEYDGTDFHGSQLQKSVRTVQGELEEALIQIYGSATRVRLAGRTDAGVHAAGQVAVFDGEDRLDPGTLRAALNFHSPEDISVRCVEKVEDNFDPRRDALKREYIFTISDGFAPSAIWRRTEVWTKQRLDIEEMTSAAAVFIGSHDFVSFAGPATPVDATTIRHVNEVNIHRNPDDRVKVKIIGNAFLHQQVRRMTGALVQVGTGKLSKSDLKRLVDEPLRGTAGWTLDPQGLCLARIEYGKDGPFQPETEYN